MSAASREVSELMGRPADPKAVQENEYFLPIHWVWRRGQREWHTGLSQLLAELIRERLDGGRILDVGCGDGKGSYDVQMFLGPDYQLSGADYSDRAVAFAGLMAPNLEFRVSDVRVQARAGSRYDCVVFREVLEHLADTEVGESLGMLFSLLRPGGLLVLTTPHASTPVSPKHYRHYTESSLRGFLERGGFADIEVLGFGRQVPWFLHRLYWWTVSALPVVWRICRAMNVKTSASRCDSLVCAARRPRHGSLS